VESAEIRNSIESLDLPTSAATGVFEAARTVTAAAQRRTAVFRPFFAENASKPAFFKGISLTIRARGPSLLD